MKQIIETIAREVADVVGKVDSDQAKQLARNVAEKDRVFIAGSGRSGLAGKMFAMRLMHIGYQVYVVGETITPSITEGDLLIVISGSGETKTLLNYVRNAKEADAAVYLITTNPDSSLGRSGDLVIEVPAVTKKTIGQRNTIQTLGSQFDQSVHLLLDGIVVFLLEHHANVESATLTKKHANLE
ncbi:6-phospho-3-hexuloisomerase [Lentibacillus sp. CBA3610]|uniref:6-phospho-3-hexuloisomerase n=1 Tax=Lentibacillus sp. CBA3610 TaxID=2518176 RepID=UPI0015952435|nr:6-phospho-3-hexuloisomerase [Lentibacillus sp. CBA3610]QKY70248.1 6-phospho-3-hexuloisomerase [Lentibacillus sp. CBA3610]